MAHISPRYQDPQTLVRLAWAKAGGELHHISEIERIPEAGRPTCRCPECEMRVFPILGVQRAHHFRHESCAFR
jgi:competence CoiA-like predicted nuclease